MGCLWVKFSPRGGDFLFATTNGTLLNKEMKEWFTEHKEHFLLGLSLDGNKETHDHNRSNSFDMIDIDYFLKNWPEQGVKMTLSEFSLYHFAENIKYVHRLGFSNIGGVNFFEGNFDWDKDKYIQILIPQFVELVDFYFSNEQYTLNQMFDKHIEHCESKNHYKQKWCGIGNGTNFFDFDGNMYPCPFVTPMTFSKNEIEKTMKTDFTNDNNFLDEDCYNNCYIYSICPTCAGSSYMTNKNFKKKVTIQPVQLQVESRIKSGNLPSKRRFRASADDTPCFSQVDKYPRILLK